MGIESHMEIPAEIPKKTRGDIALEEGDLSKATYYYVHEGDIRGLNKLAKALYERGKDEEAEKILKKAFEISSSIDK